MEKLKRLLALLGFAAVGCAGVPEQTHPESAWAMGRVERFEIVDTKEPIDFSPIVVTDRNEVAMLSAGYRDLEWESYFGTVPVDRTGYVLIGFRGDDEVIRVSVGPGGGFMERYGERVARFSGDALTLFTRLVDSAHAGQSVGVTESAGSMPLDAAGG